MHDDKPNKGKEKHNFLNMYISHLCTHRPSISPHKNTRYGLYVYLKKDNTMKQLETCLRGTRVWGYGVGKHPPPTVPAQRGGVLLVMLPSLQRSFVPSCTHVIHSHCSVVCHLCRTHPSRPRAAHTHPGVGTQTRHTIWRQDLPSKISGHFRGFRFFSCKANRS